MKFYIGKIALFLILIQLSWINLSSMNPLTYGSEDSINSDYISFNSDYFGKKRISDGPYIFLKDDKTIVQWISKDKLREKTIRRNNFRIIERKFGFEFQPEWINEVKEYEKNYIQKFGGVDKLIAISDIHGQYDLMIKLLRAYRVIDDDYNWAFGKGHLVILGDILDRGPEVTESLWLIFRLEQQAKKHGGKVHVLLGNHELMVLNNDARYINTKYIKTAHILSKTYPELYTDDYLMGRWLKNKPIMVTINDMLFVHAGVSIEFMKRGYTRSQTNKLFMEKIIGKDWETILSDSTLTFMMDKNGPIWFRGYFFSPYIKEYQADHLLRYFDLKHIIVGHTSFPNIVSLFEGKIYGIDSNIKEGNYGEVLIYNNQTFYRGTASGNMITIH